MFIYRKTGTPCGAQGLTFIGITFKSVVLMNYSAKGWDNIMPTSSFAIADSQLLKSWPPGQHWGPMQGLKFNIAIYKEHVKKSSSQKLQWNSLWYYYASILGYFFNRRILTIVDKHVSCQC